MGMNYYHVHKGKTTHIGKSSGGWSFMFHAPRGIKSYQDWLARLNKGGKILDEMDREISLADFQAKVESKKDGLNHARKFPNDKGNFVDADGHSMTSREFS